MTRGFRGVDIGLHLMVSVLLTGGIGYALDRYFGSLPLGMLVGGLLGFVAWLYQVWKMLQALRADSAKTAVDDEAQRR